MRIWGPGQTCTSHRQGHLYQRDPYSHQTAEALGREGCQDPVSSFKGPCQGHMTLGNLYRGREGSCAPHTRSLVLGGEGEETEAVMLLHAEQKQTLQSDQPLQQQ